MPPQNLLGILFALISAASWGGGDFSGGQAARKHSAIQVLVLAVLASLGVLIALAILWQELSLAVESVAWAAAAGVSGALGTLLLYRGLARGSAAAVAPTAAVVGAAIPVLYAAASQGLPGGAQLAGFAAGLGGIALVSAASGGPTPIRYGSREIGLAVLSGLGFGGFFVFISLGQEGKLFAPLVVSKLASLTVALILLCRQNRTEQAGVICRLATPRTRGAGSSASEAPRRSPMISWTAAWGTALLAGVLDVGGNVFYLLARQLTRLDVAAVLASMYPAVTVLLARRLLQEGVSRLQWVGLALCLISVSLIAL